MLTKAVSRVKVANVVATSAVDAVTFDSVEKHRGFLLSRGTLAFVVTRPTTFYELCLGIHPMHENSAKMHQWHMGFVRIIQ